MSTPASVLEDLPFCLARTLLDFRRFADQTLRAFGVASQAPGLASVLHAAEELGDCTVSRLVEKTGLANGTLTGLLDTLEQDGFIRRIANPEDGRSWLIQLSKKGRALCAKLHRRHAFVMQVFDEGLTSREAAELKTLLDKVSTCMHVGTEQLSSPALKPKIKAAPRNRGSSVSSHRV